MMEGEEVIGRLQGFVIWGVAIGKRSNKEAALRSDWTRSDWGDKVIRRLQGVVMGM